ncbi:solute:sodium symporter family transporter [Exiguobacterium aestuarii]|uniref:Solute:sodium symporter family transporter n=1 Tax=Exiguobacterium aestuarii TaxID=273527 RepID=A0ABW2PHT0_9BACL|nr:MULTISPECIES: solute:sodium symporter family transporter [Exiguobacterium]MCT4786030.1 solute:sodium symporter family transporter [Exiguobacterium aestuarii]
MTIQQVLYILVTGAAFMALVAYVSYRMTRGKVESADDYFLAGRGLTGVFIAGSLLLTNLSAEQLIGLNGQSFAGNMSAMAWEVTAGIAAIIMALFLLPRFLGIGISTIPEFLSQRYDEDVRRLTVLLFLLGYMCVTIPSMLYSGGLAVLQLFDVPALLGISFEQSLWIVVWFIGIIGAIYAIFGGLRAVAVSDTLNGIGLIIIGFLVPTLGFLALGDGNLLNGMKTIATTNPEKLNAIGSANDSVPFLSIFTGMIFANLFYWALNQYVIQRALGAKNLAEGQKGVLFTGYLKLLVPIFMLLPGVIAFHLYGSNVEKADLAYPSLIAELLPMWLMGFFLAVLLGAVFSSFNSLLNSIATLFVLDIYKPKFKPNASDQDLIRVSKWFGTFVALVSFFVAPNLMYAPDGLWDLIRRFTGFFNIPILVIVLIGMLVKRVPPIAAKTVVFFHVIAYYFLVWGTKQWFGVEIGINFIHIYGILFVVETGIMLIFARVRPMLQANPIRIELGRVKPWRHALSTSILLVASMIFVYLVFSPIGLAYADGIVSGWFAPLTIGLIAVTTLLIWASYRYGLARYERYLNNLGEEPPEVEEASS